MNKKDVIEKINNLTHSECARLWRFAPSDHPYLQDKELFNVFEKRFKKFGGMTSNISKKIGW